MRTDAEHEMPPNVMCPSKGVQSGKRVWRITPRHVLRIGEMTSMCPAKRPATCPVMRRHFHLPRHRVRGRTRRRARAGVPMSIGLDALSTSLTRALPARNRRGPSVSLRRLCAWLETEPAGGTETRSGEHAIIPRSRPARAIDEETSS